MGPPGSGRDGPFEWAGCHSFTRQADLDDRRMEWSADEASVHGRNQVVYPRAGADRAVRHVKRVLLATDFSTASEQATNEAIGLAVRGRAKLIVLSVVDPVLLRLPGGHFIRRVDQERTRVETAAQAIVARARHAGAGATYLVWEGDPAEAILEASESEDVDVIVLGSHNRGRLGRLILGSISTRVSAEARCRVVVVPG